MPVRTYGMKNTRVYRIWASMVARCLYPNRKVYKYYGGKGIKVCDNWCNFVGFLADMGQPPSDEHTIDRIDNDKDYEPANCRWVHKSEQNRNKKCLRYATKDGVTQCAAVLARCHNLNGITVARRIAKGLPIEEVLSITTVKNPEWNRLVEFGGETFTIAEWSRRVGIPYSTIHRRLGQGWAASDALTKPVRGRK